MIDSAAQLDAFNTPGLLLKAARERQGYSEREAADRLNLMPDYVGIIERDEYQALRSPSFARGYVRAYCRLWSWTNHFCCRYLTSCREAVRR